MIDPVGVGYSELEGCIINLHMFFFFSPFPLVGCILGGWMDGWSRIIGILVYLEAYLCILGNYTCMGNWEQRFLR